MSIVNIFAGSYCHGEEITSKLVQRLGFQYMDDNHIIAETEKRYSVPVKKLYRSLYQGESIFNSFTHERERNIAYLKMVFAESLMKENLVYNGFLGYVIPGVVSHVLKVCIIADIDYRVSEAVAKAGLSERDALKAIKKYDEERNTWSQYVFELSPWDASIYDIVIPVDKTTIDSAIGLIEENIKSDILQITPDSKRAMNDFILATKAGILLAEKGHDIEVSCHKEEITLIINKRVLRLEHIENELKKIISTMPEVKAVHTRVGAGYYKADVYRQFDYEKPSKVLLVDDERDFVQTLSKRLHMREMGSAVVYDGEEALNILKEEEPDVMVVDLKMPGIDGMEILRRVKQESPYTEVIILTGHGSKQDEQMAKELGAFAYLNKPVDIAVLTKYMQEAQKKVNEAKKSIT